MNDEMVLVIHNVIDELNEQRSAKEQLPKDKDTVLFGPDGHLDSLGVVSLIVSLENELNQRQSFSINLTNDMDPFSDHNIRWTIESLSAYLSEFVQKGKCSR